MVVNYVVTARKGRYTVHFVNRPKGRIWRDWFVSRTFDSVAVARAWASARTVKALGV